MRQSRATHAAPLCGRVISDYDEEIDELAARCEQMQGANQREHERGLQLQDSITTLQDSVTGLETQVCDFFFLNCACHGVAAALVGGSEQSSPSLFLRRLPWRHFSVQEMIMPRRKNPCQMQSMFRHS